MPYKAYSDSYLMSLTKSQIIELLRTAEHNYFTTEEALANSAKVGQEYAEKFDKAKGLLKEAYKDLRYEGICRNCKHKETGIESGRCHGCRTNWEWRYQTETKELIGKEI